MIRAEGQAAPLPFTPDRLAFGVLLQVPSLPSPYGIGDVGPAAFSWLDRLHELDQVRGRLYRCWPMSLNHL
jgi:hypothetical protein